MRNLIRSLCLLTLYLLPQLALAQVPVLSSYPSASATIFLDFDGHTVTGTSWNWSGAPIVCQSSGLNTTQVTHIFNRVAEDYRPFNINITTDSTKFLAAPINKRMRVIITTSSSWYGDGAGGVAFIGSFTGGDDTPCFVFSALFGYNLKKISEAVSHEAGHTLGLYHQAQYDGNCNKITDYYAGQGSGEIGWAPIMGVGYNRNFTLWSNGPNSFGCNSYQSDLDVITSSKNGFGYRQDDHGKTFDLASPVIFSNNQFNMAGVVERNTDEDMFRFAMPLRGRFQLNATPYNVGTGNAGSNLDMQLSLYNGSQTLLNVYNPGTLLNSLADTILNPGVYYIKVEGKGNLYAPAYASLGSYSLSANLELDKPLALHKLELKGTRQGDTHQLHWEIEADEQVVEQAIEVSVDGTEFTALAGITLDTRNYGNRPNISANYQYRLKLILSDGKPYYSNTVTFRKNQASERPKLLSNLINSPVVTISSPDNYSYQILDFNGRVLQRGQLVNGINTIAVPGMTTGMYIVRIADDHQQWTDKLLRR